MMQFAQPHRLSPDEWARIDEERTVELQFCDIVERETILLPAARRWIDWVRSDYAWDPRDDA